MIDEHQVRERAYYIWEDEGRGFGRAEAHWFQAKAEVMAATPLNIEPVVADASLAPSPAKALKPSTNRTKASASKTAVTKVPAKVAKADAPKAAAKAKRAPRAASVEGIALH